MGQCGRWEVEGNGEDERGWGYTLKPGTVGEGVGQCGRWEVEGNGEDERGWGYTLKPGTICTIYTLVHGNCSSLI